MEHTHEGLSSNGGGKGIKQGFLLSFILVVGVGVVNFGYSIGVFNSLMLDWLIVYQIDGKDNRDNWSSLITTVLSIGLAIGCLTTGPLVRFGKKNCIHFANIFLAIGCGMTLIRIKEVAAAGRFIQGLAAGSFTVFVPSFINELTPTELKGPFGSATQILITLGIFISQALGIPLPDCQKGAEKDDLKCDKGKNIYTGDTFVDTDYWRLIFAIPIALAVL
jgi:MFS family permease